MLNLIKKFIDYLFFDFAFFFKFLLFKMSYFREWNKFNILLEPPPEQKQRLYLDRARWRVLARRIDSWETSSRALVDTWTDSGWWESKCSRCIATSRSCPHAAHCSSFELARSSTSTIVVWRTSGWCSRCCSRPASWSTTVESTLLVARRRLAGFVPNSRRMEHSTSSHTRYCSRTRQIDTQYKHGYFMLYSM